MIHLLIPLISFTAVSVSTVLMPIGSVERVLVQCASLFGVYYVMSTMNAVMPPQAHTVPIFGVSPPFPCSYSNAFACAAVLFVVCLALSTAMVLVSIVHARLRPKH